MVTVRSRKRFRKRVTSTPRRGPRRRRRSRRRPSRSPVAPGSSRNGRRVVLRGGRAVRDSRGRGHHRHRGRGGRERLRIAVARAQVSHFAFAAEQRRQRSAEARGEFERLASRSRVLLLLLLALRSQQEVPAERGGRGPARAVPVGRDRALVVYDCENRGAFVSASASFGGATFERARKGGETTRAAIFQPGKKRTTERGRRDEKTGRPPRGEIWRHLRTSRGFLADEPEGRQPAPLPHGELVVVHRLRGVCVRGAGWLGGDSNRTRRFSFVSRQIRRVRHRALRVDARDARTTCALSASPASRVPLRREARSAWLFVATSARLLSSRLSSRSGARWYANSSANNEVERIFADSHQAAGVWRSGCAVIRFRRKRSRTAFRFSSRNASIQTLAPLRAVVTPPLLRRRRTSGRIRRLRSGSPSAPGRHQARPRRGCRPRPRGRGR